METQTENISKIENYLPSEEEKKSLYHNITCSLLVHLRGGRTQLEMSSLLGYSSNQYYKLEAGLKILYLGDFLSLLEKLNFPVQQILNEGISIRVNSLESSEVTKSLFATWLPKDDEYIGKKIGCSASRVWRVRNSKTDLHFTEFLAIIDFFMGRLSEFLSLFVPIASLPQALQNHTGGSDPLTTYRLFPEVSIITCSIYLYKVLRAKKEHKKEALFKVSNMPRERFEACLKHLLDHNFIYQDVDGNYRTHHYKLEVRSHSNDDAEIAKQIWRYWLNEARERIEENLYFTKRVFKLAPVSFRAKKEIRNLLSQTYREIARIVDNDDPNGRDELIFFGAFLFSNEKENDQQIHDIE